MIKKLLTITLSLMMIFTSFVPVFAEGEEVNIVGQYGIVIDKDTGQILYNKNAHDKMYPASITKILTCIVAIEMLDDLDKTATITQSDIDTVWETGATSYKSSELYEIMFRYVDGSNVTFRCRCLSCSS